MNMVKKAHPSLPLLLLLSFSIVTTAIIIAITLATSQTLLKSLHLIPNSHFQLTQTRVYNDQYPPIQSSNNITTAQLINHLQFLVAQSLDRADRAARNITSTRIHPLRAYSVSPHMQQYGYVHRDEPFDPLCLSAGPGQLARTPGAREDSVKPMCFSVLQNAYLGTCGVAIQPTTRTVFDIAGGCCFRDWTSYKRATVHISKRETRSFDKFRGKIVLSLAHHHSTTYHHVIHEVISRYLLVVPLLDAVPEILVALDEGDIAPRILQLLGLSRRRIVQFSAKCNVPQWRFASVLLSPMPWYEHEFMGFYRRGVTRHTTAILRAAVGAHAPRETRVAGRKTMVLIERAKSRGTHGDCEETRCVKNLWQVEEMLKKRFLDQFDVVLYKASYDLRTAIDMFSRAHVVIGVHGAGFQNIMFCRKGTTVVHAGWSVPEEVLYRELADELGLMYHLIVVPGLEHESRNYVLGDLDVFEQNVSQAMKYDGVFSH